MKMRIFNYKLITTTFVCLFFAMFVLGQPVFAADVAFDVQVSPASVKSGDTVEITVGLISSSEAISSYSYTVNYDSAILEPAGALNEISDGCVSYDGTGDGTTEPQTMTFIFTAVSSGTVSIETAATEIVLSSGESVTAAPAYNSITISNESASDTADTDSTDMNADGTDTTDSNTAEAYGQYTSEQGLSDSSAVQGTYDTQTEDTAADDETDTLTDDEVGTLTEADAPEGTLVSLHSASSLYYVLSKPDSVDVPSSYLPVTISLNDVDVKAYKRATDDDTVLLYATNADGNPGWYFFNVSDGSFLNAEDLIDGDGALGTFVTKYKFIIMLIAIIILVVLIVVIVMLAISFKNVIKDYEARIEKLKAKEPDNAEEDDEYTDEDIPTIGDKALFPSDEDIQESYADSDYDNQVQFDEDDFSRERYYSDDDMDDTDDTDDSDISDDYDETETASAPNAPANGANVNNAGSSDSETSVKQSMAEIDKVLKSAGKYK